MTQTTDSAADTATDIQGQLDLGIVPIAARPAGSAPIAWPGEGGPDGADMVVPGGRATAVPAERAVLVPAERAALEAAERAALQAAWLILTRETLPALAAARDWPVSADHCFMRILLDAVHGERWDAQITRRPAYRHITTDRLAAAIALGEAAAAGQADLWALNTQSLALRATPRKGRKAVW